MDGADESFDAVDVQEPYSVQPLRQADAANWHMLFPEPSPTMVPSADVHWAGV